MDIFTSYITLDLDTDNAYVTTSAKQGDDKSRAINITIIRNKEKWEIPSYYDVRFDCCKPDGHAVSLSGPEYITIEDDGTVTVLLPFQSIAVAGRVYASIIFSDGDQVLSPVGFIINVMARPNIGNQAKSTSEFIYLVELVKEAKEVIYSSEAWAVGTRNGKIGIVTEGTNYYSDAACTELVDETTEVVEVFKTSEGNYKITVEGIDYYVAVASVYYPEEYHNNENAKYWAEHAQEVSGDASEYMQRAEAAAEAAEQSEANAKESEINANTSSINAYNSANSANISATNASNYAFSANNYSLKAESWATGQRQGQPVPSTDETYQNNAKYYSNNARVFQETAHNYSNNARTFQDNAQTAANIAQDASSSAKQSASSAAASSSSANSYADAAEQQADNSLNYSRDSEAYAKGTRNNQQVTSSDPAYQNNSKYYSEQSNAYATAAQESAAAAAGSASEIEDLEVAATKLSEGSDPTVTKTTVGTPSHYKLTFGIPEGQKIDYKGVFSASTQYIYLDLVKYNDSAYMVITQNTVPAGTLPTNNTYWLQISWAYLDANHVNYSDSTTYSSGTIGQKVKENSTNISNLDSTKANITYVDGEINDLQGQIDAIVSSSDVVDIVGTYADLQSYDTSKLRPNDIVKVLADEQHSGARSYYRWNTSWIYIGSEAISYTKSEEDNLLNLKQDKSNLVTSFQSTPDNTHYPSEKLVKDNINTLNTNIDSKISKSAQASKTSSMTHEVGIDSNGKLWVEAGNTAEDVLYDKDETYSDGTVGKELQDQAPYIIEYNSSNPPQIDKSKLQAAIDSGKFIYLKVDDLYYHLTEYEPSARPPSPLYAYVKFELITDRYSYWYKYEFNKDSPWTEYEESNNIFVAKYNTTTFDEVLAAYNDLKYIFVKMPSFTIESQPSKIISGGEQLLMLANVTSERNSTLIAPSIITQFTFVGLTSASSSKSTYGTNEFVTLSRTDGWSEVSKNLIKINNISASTTNDTLCSFSIDAGDIPYDESTVEQELQNLNSNKANTTYVDQQDNLKVDKTTTINNKALSSNITLNSDDVGAVPVSSNIINADIDILFI